MTVRVIPEASPLFPGNARERVKNRRACTKTFREPIKSCREFTKIERDGGKYMPAILEW
jgi:hypothetical protein